VDSLENLDLFVAAMAEESFKEKIKGHDMREMVLIAGDRYEVLRHVVERGVRVLIVVGDLPIPEDICEIARQNEVTILSTAFDTSTSAWLTRLATPVGHLAQTDYVTLHEEDRLEQLKVSLMHSPVPGVLVLNDRGDLLSVATKSNLFTPSRRKLILVDHNELSQAVAGADKVEIIEIVDHHRLGNLQTDKPIQFINKPLGSTCTLVATLYQQAGIDPEPAIAGVMLAGLLSDTIVLKSPTTTDVDRQIAFWLGQHSGLDAYEFGQRIFSSSSAISAYDTLTDVITSDFKVFQAGSYEFGIGQVEVVSFHEFLDRRQTLAAELEQVRKHKGLAITGLLVTDIVAGDSMLLVAAEEGMAFAMGYPQREGNLYELKGVLSRKKQLIPHLLRVLSN